MKLQAASTLLTSLQFLLSRGTPSHHIAPMLQFAGVTAAAKGTADHWQQVFDRY